MILLTIMPKPITRLLRSCLHCGGPFTVWPASLKRSPCLYCSSHCYHAASRRLPEDRFWEKVQKSDGCWIWTAHRSRTGYGKFLLDGKATTATRFCWELHNGGIPAGLFVLHKCDNPPCVNPTHLFLGSLSDNMQDSSRKGRIVNGEHHHSAKLTPTIVRSIRKAFRPGKTNIAALARHHGISTTAMYRVIIKRTWKHV